MFMTTSKFNALSACVALNKTSNCALNSQI